MSKLDEAIVIKVINSHCKANYKQSTDDFSSYDALTDNCLLEIKVRSKDYGDVVIEKSKRDRIIADMKKLGKKKAFFCAVNDSGYHIINLESKCRIESFPVFGTTDFHKENDSRKMTEFCIWSFDFNFIPRARVKYWMKKNDRESK